jgi:hypothetical protein
VYRIQTSHTFALKYLLLIVFLKFRMWSRSNIIIFLKKFLLLYKFKKHFFFKVDMNLLWWIKIILSLSQFLLIF